MVKKALLLFYLISIIILNLEATVEYSSKPVIFYGGPDQRIFGFSKNKIRSVSDIINPIGIKPISDPQNKNNQEGTGGTVQFILNQDSSGASTGPFYFYWKLYTPEPTTIQIKDIQPLKNASYKPGDHVIHWYNNTLVNNVILSTTNFTAPVVIYAGTRLEKPEAGSQEFNIDLESQSGLENIPMGTDLVYTGSIVIEVIGL